MKFPTSSNRLELNLDTPTAADQYSNGVRLVADGSATYATSSTTGSVVSNGLLLDANGAVVIEDAATGFPSGVTYTNGLPISRNGALCTSTAEGVIWANGIPFTENGAVSAWSTVNREALAILASYGTDAHIYLPGIGVVNGLTAGNFSDTGGVTAAIVDSTAGVGRVNDGVGSIPATQGTTANKPILRRGAVNRATQSENILAASGYGVNGGGTLTRNQTAPNGTTTASLFTEGVTAASAHFITNPATTLTFNAGVSYTQTWYVKAGTSTRCQITFPSAPFGSGQYANFGLTGAGSVLASAGGTASIAIDEQGFYRCRFTATCSTTGTGNVAILAFINSDVSTRLPNYTGTDLTLTVWGDQTETGSTASPYIPTTTAAASSPTGPYWWEFDGTDFLSLAAVPFQASDDSCVILAANHSDPSATSRAAFSVTGAAGQRAATLYVNNRTWRLRFVNDATTSFEIAAVSTVDAGVTAVISGRKVGNARLLRLNGVSQGTDSAAIGTTTVTASDLGRFALAGTGPFLGAIYPVIAIKGTVTDADLAILERYVAQASGVTL